MNKPNIDPAKIPVKTALSLLQEHPNWYLFPIQANAKYPPLFERNLELAENRLGPIVAWSHFRPGVCNYGLSLKKSKMIVVDVDGPIGRDTLDRLELEHGQLPRTFVVQSPSGGAHYYFNETDLVKHRMRVGAFGPKVDSTNYVLLPGSAVNGIRYKIITHNSVADAPAWFAEYLTDAPTIGDNSQAPAVELDTPDLIAWAVHFLTHDAKPSIQFQNGEYTLLMTAAVLKDHGISKEMAVELLAEHFNPRCEPPWDINDCATADRLDVKVHNAWAYLHQTQPGAHTAQAAFAGDPGDDAALAQMIEWWERRDNRYCLIGGQPYPKKGR